MIFEVDANQIERLDANQVVELLRRLVHAELLTYGIPLRSGSVPAQITIADGGEDGRVEWSGAQTKQIGYQAATQCFKASAAQLHHRG